MDIPLYFYFVSMSQGGIPEKPWHPQVSSFVVQSLSAYVQ